MGNRVNRSVALLDTLDVHLREFAGGDLTGIKSFEHVAGGTEVINRHSVISQLLGMARSSG